MKEARLAWRPQVLTDSHRLAAPSPSSPPSSPPPPIYLSTPRILHLQGGVTLKTLPVLNYPMPLFLSPPLLTSLTFLRHFRSSSPIHLQLPLFYSLFFSLMKVSTPKDTISEIYARTQEGSISFKNHKFKTFSYHVFSRSVKEIIIHFYHNMSRMKKSFWCEDIQNLLVDRSPLTCNIDIISVFK